MSASEGNHDGRYNRTQNAQNRLQPQFRAVLDLLLPRNGTTSCRLARAAGPTGPARRPKSSRGWISPEDRATRRGR